jgi:hypothetical protein
MPENKAGKTPAPTRSGHTIMSEYKRKASIGFGIALICVLFAGEVVVQDFIKPNAATPWVLGVLALVAATALAIALRFQARARRETEHRGLAPRRSGDAS